MEDDGGERNDIPTNGLSSGCRTEGRIVRRKRRRRRQARQAAYSQHIMAIIRQRGEVTGRTVNRGGTIASSEPENQGLMGGRGPSCKPTPIPPSHPTPPPFYAGRKESRRKEKHGGAIQMSSNKMKQRLTGKEE